MKISRLLPRRNRDQVGKSRRVTLYTRRGCHLCEEAETLLERLSKEMGFTWSAVDIDRDADLRQRYHHSVPVIAIDGEDALSAPLTEAAVRRSLAERLRS